jgi:hypothetical protein
MQARKRRLGRALRDHLYSVAWFRSPREGNDMVMVKDAAAGIVGQSHDTTKKPRPRSITKTSNPE